MIFLKGLFQVAHFGKHRSLKARIALRINDEELLLQLLPIPKCLWEENFELGFEILRSLKKRHSTKVSIELQKIFEWSFTSDEIGAKEAYQAIIELKLLVPYEKWSIFIKKTYRKYSRKRIWSYLRDRGINIRMVQGKVKLAS